MAGGDIPTIAPASLLAHQAVGTTLIASTRDVGWTSLLIDHHLVRPVDTPFETHATPDQTIVVQLAGEQRLEAYGKGRWRSATYLPGTVGLTPGERVDRLRRVVVSNAKPFEKLNLYLPATLLDQSAEHLRRAGQRARSTELDALAFADPVIWQTMRTINQAARDGMPDIYAQAAAQWLAMHLLTRHGGHKGPIESCPGEAIADPRLARVITAMSARLAEPLTLDMLAAEAGVSRFHFVRLFRLQTGKTPHAMLISLRLDAVRTMLTATDLDIGTIALRCGFGSGQSLTTMFTRRFGVSPTRWRTSRRA